MSSVKAIAIKQKPRQAMQVLDQAEVSVEGGIAGDFRGSQRGRQITLLSESVWRQVCSELDTDLPWTTRRANLLVDDITFGEASLGRQLRIGEVELLVTEETAPCSRMDEQHAGLTAALGPEWRGGICCDVVSPGTIRIGDRVEFA